jgi:hypothetical protein
MSTPDPFVTYDAAYVFGGLSPQDSAAFEAHLLECDRCARSVRELAGMPGLLAQAPTAPSPPGSPPADPGPPPASLLPDLLAGVARARHRRRLTVAATAALALAACLALLLVLTLPGTQRADGGGAAPIAMTSLVGYPVEATVSLDEDAGWARVAMNCRYGKASPGEPDPGAAEPVQYVLVAITREGETHELATWFVAPDHDVSLNMTTPLRRDTITTLEIRSPQGYPVLRAHLPAPPQGDG